MKITRRSVFGMIGAILLSRQKALSTPQHLGTTQAVSESLMDEINRVTLAHIRSSEVGEVFFNNPGLDFIRFDCSVGTGYMQDMLQYNESCLARPQSPSAFQA
jgi:hypothetical protein